MIKIYHNPRCKKSRAGLDYLQSKNVEFQIVKYLDDPFTISQLTVLLDKSGKEPEFFLRKQEDYYKKELKGQPLTSEQLIAAMVENPKLLARPIVENNTFAVLAQPPEEINKIL